MKNSEGAINILWNQKVLEHYRGYTFVTLFDTADCNYSWIAKPGLFNAHDEFQDAEIEPQVGISCGSREEARRVAIDWIRSQP